MKAIRRSERNPADCKRRPLSYKAVVAAILFIYPYMVGYTPEQDSTGTSSTLIDILTGFGQYAAVTHDCAGRVVDETIYTSFDYGAAVSHNIDEFKFGARIGGYEINYSSGDKRDYYTQETFIHFLNPFIGFENKYCEFNIGAVFLSKDYHDITGDDESFLIGEGKTQPSWIIRIGNKEKFHFSTQYLSNVPIISGGGIWDIGLGLGSTTSRNLTWIGTSAGTFQVPGLSVKQNIELSADVDLLLRGRAGLNEDNFEGAFAAGVRFQL